MNGKPGLAADRISGMRLTVQAVFKVSFNDTYFLKESIIPIGELMGDESVWFDPFLGNNKPIDVKVAVKRLSPDEIVLMERRGNTVKELADPRLVIITEDHTDSSFLASHITVIEKR